VRQVTPALEEAGRELGVDPGTVALAWLLRLPSRPIPVLGSSRLDRLRDLARADRLELDRQTWFTLLEASLGHEVP
jgi:predicted oxidoreductase